MVGTASGTRFRVVVIGKGLIGSAAARHLAGQTDGIALVGPDEPADRATRHDVFGSHYDEGRIYRILDGDLIWGTLAARSLARYAEIEAASGVSFRRDVGLLTLGAPGADGLVESYARTGDALSVAFERLTHDDVTARFPALRVGPGLVGLLQAQRAGHISPRRMVAAQRAAAERNGASVINEPAHQVRRVGDGVEVLTATGMTIQAERVLVATGAFANAHQVLPRPLDIAVSGRTIVLAEIADALLAQLQDLPSLIAEGTTPVSDLYLLPPIQYPDGRWHIKLGTGDFDHPLDTLDQLVAWFQHPGAERDCVALQQTLVNLIPALDGSPVHTDTCAVTVTPSGYPFIDLIEDGRIAIAVGGNGQAAKSADEIGRLAAELTLTGAWQDDLPAHVFAAAFRD
jgi:sarcosine oxidase